MEESKGTFYTAYIVFVCIFLVYWNLYRREIVDDVEQSFTRIKRAGTDTGKKIIDKTYEQKLSDKTLDNKMRSGAYDMSNMKWMTFVVLLKTYVTLIILYWCVRFCSFIVGSFGKSDISEHKDYQEGGGFVGNAANAFKTDAAKQAVNVEANAQFIGKTGDLTLDELTNQASILTHCCFEFGAVFGGLATATLIASVYTSALTRYRENQHNLHAVKMHVTMLSFIHIIAFLGVFSYYAFKNNKVFK